jgi:hypothetical protein
MIPMTYEPLEGVTVDVQDHAHGQVPCWIGTHGEMISSDLHGAEEPTRWMLRPQQGAEIRHRGLHRREGGCLAEAPRKSLT